MNSSIKENVNRLGRIGMIVVIIMIVSSIATGALRVFEMIRVFPMLSPELNPVLLVVEDIVFAIMGLVLCVFELRVVNGFRRCDSPFEDGVIDRLNTCAWVFLAVAALNTLMNIPSIVQMFRTHNTLNAWICIGSFLPSFPLVAALFLLFLVRIFRYGAELQQAADETL